VNGPFVGHQVDGAAGRAVAMSLHASGGRLSAPGVFILWEVSSSHPLVSKRCLRMQTVPTC
jgi:hypothetical protein